MRYAKLIEGQPVFAPNPIHINDLWVGNPTPEMLTEEGYKPVRSTEPPETEPGYIAVSGWEETAEEIVQTWTEELEPDEIPEDRAYRIITGEEE